MRRARLSLAFLLLGFAACVTDESGERDQKREPEFPAWFEAPDGVTRDAALEEAAAMLCARDTHAVIDDDVRRVAGVWQGQVAGHVERDRAKTARARVQEAVTGLLAETSGTHLGLAEGRAPGGAHCVAVVAARSALTLTSELPRALEKPEPFALGFELPERARATIFFMQPDGSVVRMETEGEKVQTFLEPGTLQGRYVLEVIVAGEDDDPEVALLWPFRVGAGQVAPVPAVLFGDEGHNDLALTRRTEALVHRLRTQQELDTLKLAPPLSRLAEARATELSEAGRLGHRLPDGVSAHEALREREQGFAVRRLAEVQGQAGTLEEAWGALLDSPAHRFELVHPKASHLGAAVVQGQDGLGRKLVSVVLLLARRVSSRPPAQLSTELLGKLNLARDLNGRKELAWSEELAGFAERHAQAMARARALTDTLEGDNVTARALDSSATLAAVRVVKAVLDDPLRLAPSRATLDADANVIGIGLVPPGENEQWYVSILVGTNE